MRTICAGRSRCNARRAIVCSSVVQKSGCGRSPADCSLRFLPTDGQIGMYGPPLQRQRFMSAKSTSIAQQRHNAVNFHGNRHTPWSESPHISCALSLQPGSTAAHT